MRCNIKLDFDLVADVCLACERGTITRDDVPEVAASKLGPLLELIHISPRLEGHEIGRSWLQADGFEYPLTHLSPIVPWFKEDFHQGVVSISELEKDDLAWISFVHKSRSGAAKAGFSADHSAKLLAAIGEIYGNVIDHSQALKSGYVAYHATPGQFEFVIGDHGIGVLQSLRSNPRYSALSNSGAALELALQTGISRYAERDHGFGFLPLLVGLANISRVIRFRSDNHAHVIVREKDGSINSHTSELAQCNGFFCSVLCDLK